MPINEERPRFDQSPVVVNVKRVSRTLPRGALVKRVLTSAKALGVGYSMAEAYHTVIERQILMFPRAFSHMAWPSTCVLPRRVACVEVRTLSKAVL